MLYDKHKKFNQKIFENPPSEYRGAPFWAWNTKLEKKILEKQIEYLKDMGFGGFHMHSRSGMATPYLSEEWFDLVKACMDKAKKENMIPYFYDEDRWPSGSAGGLVTKDNRLLLKCLYITPEPLEAVDRETALREAKTYLISVYDVELGPDGTLKSYRRISLEDKAQFDKWFVYASSTEENSWFNYSGYTDTLSKEAMDKFIDITYNGYKKAVGSRFGSEAPSIFTDEPQFCGFSTLKNAFSKEKIRLPWTTNLPEFYKSRCGLDIIDYIPELLWDLPDGKPSKARYYFHDTVCEMFVQAYMDNCGKWCDENGVIFTGHVVSEELLSSQSNLVGEAMRCYRSLTLPGIDMLCDFHEYTTAKQAQSASRQYGREGLVSELYGVTGWDFDFKGHKHQGDWQAALGVTLRVPHLSWVSMKGHAKRDYPASINYQSPWFKEYKLIENHFGRVNTLMTRGTAKCDIAVIHPIESYWLCTGPNTETAMQREQLDENFNNITNWLLKGQIDFDFVSESLLPSLAGDMRNGFDVGKMSYKTVIVPSLVTIRGTTLTLLKKFKENGGRVIFMGDVPRYVDVDLSTEAIKFAESCENCSYTRNSILSVLENERFIKITNSDGTLADNMLYSVREENDKKYVFIAICQPLKGDFSHKPNKYISNPQEVTITFKGSFVPVLYDTLAGKKDSVSYHSDSNETKITRTLYYNDSLLLELTPGTGSNTVLCDNTAKCVDEFTFKDPVDFETEEQNVVVLDIAQYSLNGEKYNPEDEILRIDTKLRKRLNVDPDAIWAQPWAVEDTHVGNTVKLKFTVEVLTRLHNIFFAMENLEASKLWLNGKEVKIKKCSYYVDNAFEKTKLGVLKKGLNVIEVDTPISMRTTLEQCYLLGDFSAQVCGCRTILSEKRCKINFGNIVDMGLPFYGGNIKYTTEIETEDCDLEFTANMVFGSTVKVYLDKEDLGHICFAPFTVRKNGVKKGKHKITFEYFGTRVNTFSFLHNTNDKFFFHFPQIWYTKGEEWSYEYNFKPQGIMTSPVVRVYKNTDK